jgi:hypothetical protein
LSVNGIKREHARQRLTAVIEEIERLKQSEFPYDQPLSALTFLQERLTRLRTILDKLSDESDPEDVDDACQKSLDQLFYYVPLLGFLLRSTNVRNAFEIGCRDFLSEMD